MSSGKTLGNLDDVLVLFGSHAAQVAAVIERLEDDLVGPEVELLHVIAGRILLIRTTQNIDQSGHVDLARDQLGRKGNVIQQIAECAARFRMPALLLENVALDGDDGSAQAWPPGSRIPCSAARACTSNGLSW